MPSMNSVLATMAPAMEAFTNVYCPRRSAVKAITSSVRLPSVAFSRPPTESPVLAATAVSGTATGVVNFLNFTFSALLGPVFGWILRSLSGGAGSMELEHYQTAFTPLLYGIGVAIILTLLLKETGRAAQPLPAAAAPAVP